MKNDREETSEDTTEIQRIIRKYYKQLDANKLNNLKETGKFLKTYNLPRLNKKETEGLSCCSPTAGAQRE